jgi:predicted permease
MRRVRRLFGNLFRSGRADRRISDEVRSHLDLLVDEKVRAGIDPREARRAALAEMGGLAPVEEQIREARAGAWIEQAWRDVAYAFRLLRRSRGFTIVAVLTLALGIGANTAIFQLLDAVRLRTLPVKDPATLAEIRIADMEGARGNFETWHPTVTHPIWEQIRAEQKAFETVFAWANDWHNLGQGGEVRLARTLLLSGEAFRTLGIDPLQGRLLGPDDDRAGCGSPAAVISHGFWQREYGGRAGIVGRTLTLAGKPVEIVGVTPRSFFGLEIGRSFDVAVPLCADPYLRPANPRIGAGTTWWLIVTGRLAPGWSLDRASAHLAAISPGIFERTLPPGYPPISVKPYLAFRLQAVPGGAGISQLRETYSAPLSFLLTIAGLVLLIACANLANLMLARAGARAREIAVRLAIGASRARIVRQFTTESLLLALAGAAAGVVLAGQLSRLLVGFLSTAGDPLLIDLPTDWRVFGFAGGLAVATCLGFGLVPALRTTRSDPSTVMKAGAGSLTATRERLGMRRILIVSQVALSLVLLTAALLFAGTLRNLMTVDAGFEQEGLIVAGVRFPRVPVPDEAVPAFKRDLVERLAAVRGIDAAARVGAVPLSGDGRANNVWIDGSVPRMPRTVSINAVGPGYFRTLRTALVAGRDFGAADTATAPKVAIVNHAFVRDFVPGSHAVGRRVVVEATPSEPETVYEIVGVAADAKYWSLREEFPPVLFLCSEQQPNAGRGARFLLRAGVPAPMALAGVRQAMAQVSPQIDLTLSVLAADVWDSLLRERLMALLAGCFAILAALLATIGLYGVVSYAVTRRRRELGIRMALGATRHTIVTMILRETAALLAVGLTIGAACSLVAARAAGALLFGVEPHDLATLATAAALLTAVTVAASYLPARRAARVDATTALRVE